LSVSEILPWREFLCNFLLKAVFLTKLFQVFIAKARKTRQGRRAAAMAAMRAAWDKIS